MPIMPGVQWKPVGNHGGIMSGHNGLVLHVQDGNGSLVGWFNNPTSQASSTFWTPKLGKIGDVGAVEQYVDSDTIAWAQGNGNGTWNSVETEGYPTEPLTDYQIWACGQIMRWLHDTYGVPYVVTDLVMVNGLGWHGMGGAAWSNHPDCPGDIRKSQRHAILDGINPAPPQPPAPEDDVANLTICAAQGSAQQYLTDMGKWKRRIMSVDDFNATLVCLRASGANVYETGVNTPVRVPQETLDAIPDA